MSKQSIDIKDLADRHKYMEGISAGQKLIPSVPVIARLDGRAFHTLLKQAIKPFDSRVVEAMQTTAKILLENFNPVIAYVQSDEITLVWDNLELFDNRIQKILSTTASMAGVIFDRELTKSNYDLNKKIPTFDCRVWQVPNLKIAAENLMWREMDATKNSVSMLASAHFSEKELDGKSTRDRLVMLESKGIIWGNLPHYLKKGSYYRKVEKLLSITETEWELRGVPEIHRPTTPILRNVIDLQEYPPATSISNFADVLFKKEFPELHGEINDEK